MRGTEKKATNERVRGRKRESWGGNKKELGGGGGVTKVHSIPG